MSKNSNDGFDIKKPRTLKDARRMGKKNSENYSAAIDEALKSLCANRALRRKISALLGRRPYKGKIRASDIEARDELRRVLIELVHAHQKQNPTQRFFFLTMFADEFRVEKSRPKLWLKRLRSKSDKVIRMLCKDFGMLGGIGTIEPAFLMNAPDLRKPVYPFHSHVLAWSEKDFDLAAAKGALQNLSNWHCSLGLDAIRIKELTADRGVASYWAYYMLKHPYDAMNIIEGENGKLNVRKTVKGYRPDARLRLLEGLAQCDMQDLIFGVKDGKFIRDPAIRRMKEARKLAHPLEKPRDVSRARKWFKELWENSRACHKNSWLIVD